jgi:glutamate formiminotransferase
VQLPLEAVPNVSEGRDAEVVRAIGDAFGRGARVLDVHTDADHHRSVYTLVGDDDELVDALVAGVAEAKARIDLRRHEGAHPRIGAADVVPLVPIRPDDMDRARAAALRVAERIGEELPLPVFLYGEVGGGRGPAAIRHGGLDTLVRRLADGELAPDFGPSVLDPRSGGVIVGARRPLIAFNVNLRSANADAAKEIAAVVRESGGGFPGVRALGLALPRAGHVQVSMNVEDWEAAALHDIVDRIVGEAATLGIEVAGAELVGLMPAGAAAAATGAQLRIAGFEASHILELRLLDATELDAGQG